MPKGAAALFTGPLVAGPLVRAFLVAALFVGAATAMAGLARPTPASCSVHLLDFVDFQITHGSVSFLCLNATY
jgi:hypothetical protein